MNEADMRKKAEKQLAEAEADKRKAFSDEMIAIRQEYEKTYKKHLSLTKEQEQSVEAEVEAVKRQTKILKESAKKDEEHYEDFVEEDKEMLLPDIRFGLLVNIRSNADANVRSFLSGKYASLVHDAMERNEIRRFRGFIALTNLSHTSVYQDIKIAQSYTLDDIRGAHGINKKTLYHVAVKESDGAAQALKDHREDLVRAKTPDEVRKILDPKYVTTNKAGPEIAISPDGRVKAEFYRPGTKGRGKIVIVPTEGNVGVSYQYWADFQSWFGDQESWHRFMAWRRLEEEKAAEQHVTLDPAEDQAEAASPNRDDKSEPAQGLFGLVKFHKEIWADETFTHPDNGDVDAMTYLGLDDGDLKDVTLRGDLLIEYIDKDGTKQVLRDTILGPDFPATSAEVTELWQKVVKEHPQSLYAGISEQDEFYVGVKSVEGTPVMRWKRNIS